MKRAALLLAAAVLPSAAQAQTAPAAPVKPIAFTERTLANGLRVYAIRDTTTPNVAVQVWYDVGSKDDPKDRSGFAHVFEHLMFKATRNLVPEQMDRLTEDVGGYNNASTNDDYTNYYEVVPANHLQRLLFAEADRMASLVVEPVSFASERDVVKEELRQSTLARPYGKLFSLYYPAVAYSVHPYARGTIGSIANLDAASIDDVRAFHATYYRPDNAVLVVAGNFDAAQLDRWIDGYFARITKAARAVPRVTVAEPARTQATTHTVYEPNTPLPAVLTSWHIPADRHPDTPALTVLNAILSTGESSRLYETLVYRDQLAQSAASILDTRQSTGNLAVYAILAGGKSAEAGEAALMREVARLRDAPVTTAELSEAKNEILTDAIRSRETAEGRASALAESVIIDGDPRASDAQLSAIARVTAADVQRVARAYLGANQAATIRYLPLEAKPAGTASAPIAIAATVQAAPLTAPADIALVTPATAAQRVQLPAPGAPVAPMLPVPVEMRLANGLRVVTVERHDLPIVTAALVATGGAATDPASRSGSASLASDLLTKGTKTRSATEIARAIESLGGSIAAGTDRDGASIGVTVKSDQIAPAMAILADVATAPAFAPEEIERARAQAIDGLTVTLKNPAALASLVAARAVFGDEPYGAPVSGTPASLAALTRDDLVRSYRRTWTPRHATLAMVGDITPAAARSLAERRFGTWRGPDAASAPGRRGTDRLVIEPAPRVIVVDLPDAGQAGVVVARSALARRDPRYYDLAVANTVLGGGFSSRLNQEIRIKRGLAYGAGSGVQALRLPGSVSARTQTKNATAPEVVALIVAEMKRMGTTLVPAAELDTRKAVLVGGFGRAIETTSGVADILGDYLVQDVPLTELARFTGAVEGVDPAAVQRAAAALLDPQAASIVVVGDAKQFLEPLRKAYPGLEVVPASALKLDSATLK
ncbi:M16 family metallopeptidase [Sphingomonas sp.]|uniref:M16 family metallopeptidase n=1 Tax=Sphingomonas sp. TaxID=28214 RepID=UPI0035BC8354